MFGDFTWSTDVLPQIQEFMGNGLVRGALIALISIAVAVYGARGLISVFFKRD